MTKLHTLSAVSAGLLCASTPAFASITVTFTESSMEGHANPAPSVVCTPACHYDAHAGYVSSVTFDHFFHTAPAHAVSGTFNLLEPAPNNEHNLAPGVSDQVIFTSDGTALTLLFSSDPLLNPLAHPYATMVETGEYQTIALPSSLVDSGLTVRVRSELEAVPEPATWAMMLLGFVGIGVGMHRRNRQLALTQVA